MGMFLALTGLDWS